MHLIVNCPKEVTNGIAILLCQAIKMRIKTTRKSLTYLNNFLAYIKGVLHPWALFLKTLCIFSKNKATSDKVSYGSEQKCSKELKNHSFTSVETIVVKLQ